MPRAALGLGSNVGDRLTHLRHAVEHLERLGRIVAVSSLYETEPVGGPDQGRYLNAVVVVDADLSPLDLLAETQRIEQEEGRVRGERWGPRTLDIDLLVYDDETMHLPSLDLPHPRAAERRFVLAPLVEVLPEAQLGEGVTAADALATLRGQRVQRWEGDWRRAFPTMGSAVRWWVAAQIVLFIIYGVSLVLVDSLAPALWQRATGIGLVVIGAVQVGWAALALGSELSPYPQPLPGASLVERGPYRFVRHPIYGGIVLGLAGVALCFGSWAGLVMTVVMAGFFNAKSVAEERALRLGVPGYNRYIERVRRRMIPFVW